MITERVDVDGYEDVFHFADTDFSAYISLHSTKLGPALGGCRVKAYASDADALQDALLLSRGMSYKNSLAGLPFGGGKCVVNSAQTTPDLMRKVGEAVEYLAGCYVTAEDVGTTVADMKFAREVTPHIVSLGPAGDPSPWTALGVFQCIMASGADPSVWVQGLGKVGMALTELLMVNGYTVYVSDLKRDRVEHAIEDFGVYVVDDASVGSCAIYAPCAMGQVVNSVNVDAMRFEVICGSANNQLENDQMADRLRSNDVLYCPDFLVNAGGVMAAASEITGFDQDNMHFKVCEIADTLECVLELAHRLHTTPLNVAMKLAEARL